MDRLLNEAIMPMLNDGLISVERLKDLIYIKDFIDRISTKKYIKESDAREIELKYGVFPNIITWGDYFQTEMATSLQCLSDDEFTTAVDAVKFDMISSHTIFSNKDSYFFEWVENTFNGFYDGEKRDYSEEEKEIIHLRFLKDYYLDLGIVPNFTAEEIKWYAVFQEAVAM